MVKQRHHDCVLQLGRYFYLRPTPRLSDIPLATNPLADFQLEETTDLISSSTSGVVSKATHNSPPTASHVTNQPHVGIAAHGSRLVNQPKAGGKVRINR